MKKRELRFDPAATGMPVMGNGRGAVWDVADLLGNAIRGHLDGDDEPGELEAAWRVWIAARRAARGDGHLQ